MRTYSSFGTVECGVPARVMKLKLRISIEVFGQTKSKSVKSMCWHRQFISIAWFVIPVLEKKWS
jgi:hypothetical protein